MPHDRDGRLLQVYDIVNIPARIIVISPNEEYCNVTVETVEPMYPGRRHDTITLNAKQVVLYGVKNE